MDERERNQGGQGVQRASTKTSKAPSRRQSKSMERTSSPGVPAAEVNQLAHGRFGPLIDAADVFPFLPARYSSMKGSVELSFRMVDRELASKRPEYSPPLVLHPDGFTPPPRDCYSLLFTADRGVESNTQPLRGDHQAQVAGSSQGDDG